MGTKNNPGRFDCYGNAEPDEPMFVLLGRDALAPSLVNIWAMIRAGNHKEAMRTFDEMIEGPQASVYILNPQSEKAQEAVDCAASMMEWRAQNNGAWRKPVENDVRAAEALQSIKDRIGDLQKLKDQPLGEGRKWALDAIWNIAHNTLLEIKK